MRSAPTLPDDFQPYACPPHFSVITSYFNPNHYRTKRTNYEIFRRSMDVSGISCVTVECVFPDGQPDLVASDGLIRIHAKDIMWQKERLLNLALQRLPSRCEIVAWIDCDVLFENPDWAVEAVSELKTHQVVQLFSDVVRLPQESLWASADGDRWESFGSVLKRMPHQLLDGDFARHGHTGFAWAARRDLLCRHGFYDSCIAGSGDHMMAHAFAGDWKGCCIDRIVGRDNEHRAHFENWARSTYRDVRARVSAVSGTLFHLWHGDTNRRRYVLRNRELAAFGFDPANDLRISDAGAWEWASGKSDMHAWAVEYFGQRCEDGVPAR
jgi:hypothetical protein